MNILKGKISSNVQLMYAEGEAYANGIGQFNTKFDIVIVDGILRAECSRVAPQFLSERGVIIVDDAERAAYKDLLGELTGKGFKRIDFWGLTPTILYNKSTTVFYRDGNCLNI
jgi:hypothetical protein